MPPLQAPLKSARTRDRGGPGSMLRERFRWRRNRVHLSFDRMG
jgi:hypothetical protein